MDKDSLSQRSNLTNNANVIHTNGRETTGTDGTSLLRPAGSDTITQTTSSEFVLQWGNRKRLRCMKVQVKDNDPTAPVQRTTVRVDRRVVRADKDSLSHPAGGNNGIGYLNLRQRHPSPQPPPPPPSQRILRNSEASGAMRGQSNGVARGIASPDRVGAHDKRGNQANNHSINLHHHHHHHHHNNHNENNKSAASSETAHESKKGGGSSSGSGEAIPPVWPPKFVIALTNKEKEEDFMAIKGSKLPQRPKKRAKFIQRTLNLVSPGAWLCDLTLERYEVREKKISKKRPRGLKAMGNMDSDSE